MDLKVSVVVPTYRDWKQLLACVQALGQQTFGRDEFEVIVVDNDPNGDRPTELPGTVQYLKHPDGFSYAARNAGIRLSRAPIIAFTDADCVPDPRWLETAWIALERQHRNVCLAAGSVEFDTTNRSLVAEYDRVFGIPQERFATTMAKAATANLLVRRHVFDAVGLFDETLESAGDTEFSRRAARHGFQLVYVPEARVWHPVRDSFSALLRKSSRMGRGLFQQHLNRASTSDKPRHARYVIRLFRPRLGQWWSVLSGKAAPGAALPKRLALVALRVFFHYHRAFVQLMMFTRTTRK